MRYEHSMSSIVRHVWKFPVKMEQFCLKRGFKWTTWILSVSAAVEATHEIGLYKYVDIISFFLYEAVIWEPYGAIWATSIWTKSYGTHVEPGCTPYMGSPNGTHIGMLAGKLYNRVFWPSSRVSKCSRWPDHWARTPAYSMKSLNNFQNALTSDFELVHIKDWIYHSTHIRERSGSVEERLTRDRGVAGSSLTGVAALWSLSKTQLS